MALEICPKCAKKLYPPLKSSGRQICTCGWSDKPVVRQGTPQVTSSGGSLANKLISKIIQPLAAKLQPLTTNKRTLGISICVLILLPSGGIGAWSWTHREIVCSTRDGKTVYSLLSDVSQQWDDEVKLAGSTSRMSLPPRIAELQNVRRKVQIQEWPDCAQAAQAELIKAMDSTIDGFITFLDPDNSDFLSSAAIERGRSHFLTFEMELQKMKPKD